MNTLATHHFALMPSHGALRPSAQRSLVLAAGLLLAATVVQAQAAEPAARSSRPDTVIGSGVVQTESRAVRGFQAITLRGSMNLVLRQGPREGVEIRADHNLLPLIDTRVVDGAGMPTLEIGGKSGTSYSTRSEMTVTVDLIDLKALTISGSGDSSGERLKADVLKVVLSGSGGLKLRQLTAQALDLKVSGSGDVEAAGQSARVDVSLAGSGSADLQGLLADDVGVRIAGSGDARVHARRGLTVTIIGSGDVIYAGDPVLKSSVKGSGSVTRR